ncbi:hypothetical protein Anapl_00727 [Anas platyrhynchos]|uniref:Uncharacterized protein n=1 Tax=Anas platyrhynchos TaxID=8839 RepID=R0L4D4_ANAPL|nr:hypothetical protein Anapl_00727 [Anas platyrhynchos]
MELPVDDFSPGCKGEPDGASKALVSCCGLQCQYTKPGLALRVGAVLLVAMHSGATVPRAALCPAGSPSPCCSHMWQNKDSFVGGWGWAEVIMVVGITQRNAPDLSSSEDRHVKRTRLLTGAGYGNVLQGCACSWQEQRAKVQLGQTHPKRVLLWEGRAVVWRYLWWVAVLGKSLWGWGRTAVSLCQLLAVASRALCCAWVLLAPAHCGWGACGCCRLLAFFWGDCKEQGNASKTYMQPGSKSSSLVLAAVDFSSLQLSRILEFWHLNHVIHQLLELSGVLGTRHQDVAGCVHCRAAVTPRVLAGELRQCWRRALAPRPAGVQGTGRAGREEEGEMWDGGLVSWRGKNGAGVSREGQCERVEGAAAQEGGECVRGVDLCGVTLRGAPGQPAQGKAGSVENGGRAEEQQQNVGLLIGESLQFNFLFHSKQAHWGQQRDHKCVWGSISSCAGIMQTPHAACQDGVAASSCILPPPYFTFSCRWLSLAPSLGAVRDKTRAGALETRPGQAQKKATCPAHQPLAWLKGTELQAHAEASHVAPEYTLLAYIPPHPAPLQPVQGTALKRESCPGGAGGMQLCRKGIYSSQLTHLGPPNVGHKERAGGFYIAPLPPSTDSSRAAFSFWAGAPESQDKSPARALLQRAPYGGWRGTIRLEGYSSKPLTAAGTVKIPAGRCGHVDFGVPGRHAAWTLEVELKNIRKGLNGGVCAHPTGSSARDSQSGASPKRGNTERKRERAVVFSFSPPLSVGLPSEPVRVKAKTHEEALACCQDFPLYLRAGAVPGLAQRSVRHGAGHQAWARGCEEQWGTSCRGAAVPGEALPGPQLPSVSIKAEILAELVYTDVTQRRKAAAQRFGPVSEKLVHRFWRPQRGESQQGAAVRGHQHAARGEMPSVPQLGVRTAVGARHIFGALGVGKHGAATPPSEGKAFFFPPPFALLSKQPDGLTTKLRFCPEAPVRLRAEEKCQCGVRGLSQRLLVHQTPPPDPTQLRQPRQDARCPQSPAGARPKRAAMLQTFHVADSDFNPEAPVVTAMNKGGGRGSAGRPKLGPDLQSCVHVSWCKGSCGGRIQFKLRAQRWHRDSRLQTLLTRAHFSVKRWVLPSCQGILEQKYRSTETGNGYYAVFALLPITKTHPALRKTALGNLRSWPELAPIPAAVGVAASLLSCPDPPVFIPLLLSQTQSPLCHRCRTHTPVTRGVVRAVVH